MTVVPAVAAQEVVEFVEAWISITRWLDMAGCTERRVVFEDPRCAAVTLTFADFATRTFKVVSPDCFATLRGASVYEMKPKEIVPMQMTQQDVDLARKAEGLGPLQTERERMNLRDKFAAAALSGMLARPDIDDEPLELHFLCEHAYKWADAMLEARNANPPE